MEKIIGGIELENPVSASIQHRLLWPCFEFVASAEGLDDFGKNIIEEVFLKLADINVVSDSEIASCTALDADLISFMHSRLQQKGWLDGTCRITDEGRAKLEQFSKKKAVPIRVYVDALTGRIIPHISAVSDKNAGEFRYESPCFENQGDVELFSFKRLSSSAGLEKETALKLHYELIFDEKKNFRTGKWNSVPSEDDVSAMLHKIFPRKDSIVVRIADGQDRKKNLRWMLIDLLLPEGDSRNWVCTDGFGHISTFFSPGDIPSENDQRYITGLRARLLSGTNAKKNPAFPEKKVPYPRIAEKIAAAQKSMNELSVFADSPDKEEELRSAENDSALYVTQLAEWTLFYILKDGDTRYKAAVALSQFDEFKKARNSDCIIGDRAVKEALSCGFNLEGQEKKGLRARYGRLKDSLEKNPSLIALADLALFALKDEAWFKSFAKEHGAFISTLLKLNSARNNSFHSGGVGLTADEIRSVYGDICTFLFAGLGVRVSEKNELTFAEKTALRNERNSAIAQMEKELGFTLCHTLDPTLLRFYTDMVRRSPVKEGLNNAVVLDIYRTLETVFVAVNEGLGDDYIQSDWKLKTRSCGFEFDGGEKCRSLIGTKEHSIHSALERRPSSLGGACIAFLTLADEQLLRELKNKWRSFPADISCIVQLRGHGEIPEKIEAERIWNIRNHVTELILFFAKKGFLT